MKTIGMSGCYDVLHDGHHHILESAIYLLEADGTLVIAINTDESVRAYKGEGRPVDTLKVRMENVSNFCNQFCIETIVVSFNTEKELAEVYDRWDVDAILHGDDIRDVHTVTGFPKYPVIIVDRGFDKNGERTSSTKLIEERNG